MHGVRTLGGKGVLPWVHHKGLKGAALGPLVGCWDMLALVVVEGLVLIQRKHRHPLLTSLQQARHL